MKKLNESILMHLKESEEKPIGELHTVDNDPAWAEAVARIYAKYKYDEPDISEEIEEEFRAFRYDLLQSGLTLKEINQMPESKAYRDAIKDPDDIWCKCGKQTKSTFKPDGESYLGVDKHAYICDVCKKYTQIG